MPKLILLGVVAGLIATQSGCTSTPSKDPARNPAGKRLNTVQLYEAISSEENILRENQVNLAVRTNFRRLQYCYEKNSGQQKEFTTVISILFSVNEAGKFKVRKIEPADTPMDTNSGQIDYQPLLNCLAEQIEHLQIVRWNEKLNFIFTSDYSKFIP